MLFGFVPRVSTNLDAMKLPISTVRKPLAEFLSLVINFEDMRFVNARILFSAFLSFTFVGFFLYGRFHKAASLLDTALTLALFTVGVFDLVRAFSAKNLQFKKPAA